MAITNFEVKVRVTAPRLKGDDAINWCEAHGITPSTDVRFMSTNDTLLYIDEATAELFPTYFQSARKKTITIPLAWVLDAELYVEENEANKPLLIGYKIPSTRAEALLTAYAAL